jgi:hypothetical protein
MGSPRTYRVGRDPDNDIVIEHSSVSRRHCELQLLDDGAVLLVDLGSKNGTSVRENGAWSPIERATVERDERILLGEIVTTVSGLLLRAPQSASAASSRAPDARLRGPTAPASDEDKSFVRRLLSSDWARLNRRRDGTRPPYADAGIDPSSICLPSDFAAGATALPPAPSLPVLAFATPQAAAPRAAALPRLVIEDAPSQPRSMDILPPSRPRPAAKHPRDPAKWAIIACALVLCASGAYAGFAQYTALSGARSTAATGPVAAATTTPAAKADTTPDRSKETRNEPESRPPPAGKNEAEPEAKPAAPPETKSAAPKTEPPPPAARATPWHRSLPAGANSAVLAASATREGGLCLVGSQSPKDGRREAWIWRVDAAGRPIWQRAAGGSRRDAALAVAPTADGGCIAAGHDSADAMLWIARYDAKGKEAWSKAIPAGHAGRATAIVALRDGDFALAGYARGTALEVERAFAMRLAANGTTKWSKHVTPGESQATDLREGKDGEIVVAGTGTRAGGDRAVLWATKIDARGQPIWHRQIGGVGRPAHVQLRMARGEEAIVAATMQGPQPAAGDAPPLTLRVLRLSRRGAVLWDRRLGDAPRRLAGFVLQTGRIVIAGDAGADAEKPELWLARLDANGRVLHEDRMAAARGDAAAALAELRDGRLVLAGTADLDPAGKRGAGLLYFDSTGARPR